MWRYVNGMLMVKFTRKKNVKCNLIPMVVTLKANQIPYDNCGYNNYDLAILS